MIISAEWQFTLPSIIDPIFLSGLSQFHIKSVGTESRKCRSNPKRIRGAGEGLYLHEAKNRILAIQTSFDPNETSSFKLVSELKS